MLGQRDLEWLVGNNWWDWIRGFRVCMDHGCSATVAEALTDPMRVAQEVMGMATSGAGISLGFALTIIGFVLGLNILAMNGPNGVCIYCTWPWWGGIIFWAFPR